MSDPRSSVPRTDFRVRIRDAESQCGRDRGRVRPRRRRGGLLGRRGLQVLVLERDAGVFPLPRAAHVDHTGLRTWQELGVVDQLLPRMLPNRGLDFLTGTGKLLARIPNGGLSASGLPFSRYFYQPELDRIIRDAVAALPTVEVRVGATVTGLDQSATAVTVEAVTETGREAFTAPWLLACDERRVRSGTDSASGWRTSGSRNHGSSST